MMLQDNKSWYTWISPYYQTYSIPISALMEGLYEHGRLYDGKSILSMISYPVSSMFDCNGWCCKIRNHDIYKNLPKLFHP